MTKGELKLIGEYTKRGKLYFNEAQYLRMLLLKWMYEQGLLQ